MSSFCDDFPRGAPICLIVFVGAVIVLSGFILQRFLPEAVSVAFFFMVILFATIICLYGIKKGVLN